MKRILLLSGQCGLGDSLCGLCALRALRRLNHGAELSYACSHPALTPPWASALSWEDIGGHPRNGAKGEELSGAKSEWNAHLGSFRKKWDAVHDATVWEEEYHATGWRVGWPRLPEFFARVAGVKIEAEDCLDVVEISPSDRERACDFVKLHGDHFAVIAGGPCHAAHWVWRPETRKPVIDALLAKGLHVVSLAGSDGVEYAGVRAFRCESAGFGAALIGLARLYVGPDTGTSWQAVLGTRTPCVIITRPEMHGAGLFNLFDDPRVFHAPNNATDAEKIAVIEKVLSLPMTWDSTGTRA